MFTLKSLVSTVQFFNSIKKKLFKFWAQPQPSTQNYLQVKKESSELVKRFSCNLCELNYNGQ
jgi:hypothetical protein